MACTAPFRLRAALVLLAPLLLATPLRADPQALQVEHQGVLRQLPLADVQAAAGGVRILQVLEPHEGRQRAYVGVPAVDLLDALFGAAWREADSVVFACADGYRALVEPARLLSHGALLAWARADGAPFTLVNTLQNDERVTLAPYYLVWDNLGSPALQAEGASGWPYQVVGVSLVQLDQALARLQPPADAAGDPAVQRGFAAFRRHCVSCHRINGQGGAKAPELNHPVSVTEYLAPGWLERWMLEPTSIRYDTSMPGLPAALPRRSAVASDIAAYLRAVARRRWEGPTTGGAAATGDERVR